MNVWHKKRKNKRKMKELLSSLNIGIRNAKRFCYILYIIVGVILMLCGIIGITIALFKQQSVPFYLFLFLISLFGFFAFYRGWIGNKAYKQLPLPKDNKSWVVFRSYPLSFWIISPVIKEASSLPKKRIVSTILEGSKILFPKGNNSPSLSNLFDLSKLFQIFPMLNLLLSYK